MKSIFVSVSSSHKLEIERDGHGRWHNSPVSGFWTNPVELESSKRDTTIQIRWSSIRILVGRVVSLLVSINGCKQRIRICIRVVTFLYPRPDSSKPWSDVSWHNKSCLGGSVRTDPVQNRKWSKNKKRHYSGGINPESRRSKDSSVVINCSIK